MGRVRFSHTPDPFQQEAIACRDKGIRIVAPAGSGKTETLARRVAVRIESGVDPRRMLVLTFDNNARKSLEGFVREFSPEGQVPVVRTLNQVGNDILRKHFPDQRCPIPAQSSEEVKTLRRHFDVYRDDLPVLEWDGVRRSPLDVFEALKNQGYEPGSVPDIAVQTRWLRREYLRLPNLDESASLDDFWGMPTGAMQTDAHAPQIARILELYAEHDQLCRSLGIMGYTDQKSRAFHALQRNHTIRKEIREAYDEVIVDECQDINRLDACLIWAIVDRETTLVLAGDDDQTLYEFRNAHSLYLREPERFFTDRAFTTIHLNINYRSPEAILDAANALIGHNVERIDKSPKSGVHRIGEVVVLAADSSANHNIALLGSLQEVLGRPISPGEHVGYRDVAFLCHNDDIYRQTVSMLRSARIPIFNDDRRSGPLVHDGVDVLTFRKAKGRQWPIVFLPGSNDRVLPDDQSLREGHLESVRRRYYVAMTRASGKLIISYLRADDRDIIHKTISGEVVSTNGASRFLFEAGLVGQASGDARQDSGPAVAVPDAPVTPSVTAPGPEPVTLLPTDLKEDPILADVAPASATPRVEVIVAPVIPPAPSSLKPRRATRPWELRQKELQSLNKAGDLWEQKEYEFAVLAAWKPVEAIMRRVVKMPPGWADPGMVHIIDRACTSGQIEPAWADRLHAWRKVRNDAAHDSEDVISRNPAKLKTGSEIVQQATEFLAYYAQRVAPKQVDLETRDDYLFRLTRLVEMIGSGQPMPRTGRPLKALRFDPDREAMEMLPLQLLMVLRDIRFFIPDDYRWSSAPLIGRLLVDTLGGMLDGIRPNGRHASAHGDKLDQERVYGHLTRLLEREARGEDPPALLERAVSDALNIGNGSFHAGLKLNPKKLMP